VARKGTRYDVSTYTNKPDSCILRLIRVYVPPESPFLRERETCISVKRKGHLYARMYGVIFRNCIP